MLKDLAVTLFVIGCFAWAATGLFYLDRATRPDHAMRTTSAPIHHHCGRR